MSQKSINFLHLTVSQIQPGQDFNARHQPFTKQDAMSENNTFLQISLLCLFLASGRPAHAEQRLFIICR